MMRVTLGATRSSLGVQTSKPVRGRAAAPPPPTLRGKSRGSIPLGVFPWRDNLGTSGGAVFLLLPRRKSEPQREPRAFTHSTVFALV
jgi:hypothetical protein